MAHTHPRRLLDIVAGHGLFGISAAQAIPSLEVIAIDWSAVLTVADENASAAGVAQRYRTIGGSAFDVDWGEGYLRKPFDEKHLMRCLRAALHSGDPPEDNS